MEKSTSIWVLPEINNSSKINNLSLGLLSVASEIAKKIGANITVLIFNEEENDYTEICSRFGIKRIYFFKDPLFRYFSPDVYAMALREVLSIEKPLLFLFGNTVIGRELAPRLAINLQAEIISNCARIDFVDENIKFYRIIFNDQLFQEIVYKANSNFVVIMNSEALSLLPEKETLHREDVEMRVIQPKLSQEVNRTKHIEYFPVDYKTLDVVDADVIVSIGMGCADDDLIKLAGELADLINGTLGTTRPVVDEGKLPRERMIGQTGKVVGPEFYIALGISGASHHVGGIQGTKKIVAINNDPNAIIFQNSDIGIIGDLKEILPKLVEKIKYVKNV